jgi:predicted transposase YdaD
MMTYTLLGLRHTPDVVDQLMPGLEHMRDSSTYQAILDEGRAEGRTEGRTEGALEVLVEMGTRRFGPPDAQTQATLAAIDDHTQLRTLAARLLDTASWAELLAGEN